MLSARSKPKAMLPAVQHTYSAVVGLDMELVIIKYAIWTAVNHFIEHTNQFDVSNDWD